MDRYDERDGGCDGQELRCGVVRVVGEEEEDDVRCGHEYDRARNLFSSLMVPRPCARTCDDPDGERQQRGCDQGHRPRGERHPQGA